MDVKFPNSLQAAPAGAQAIPAVWHKTSNRQRWVIAALLLAVLAALAIRFFWPAPANLDVKPPSPVQVGIAVQKPVTMVEHTIGTILAQSTIQVTALVGGQLLSTGFVEGQMVHKNDVLFRIDPKPYIAALAQAKGQFARDKAALDNARIDLTRYQKLAKEKAVSDQVYQTQIATARTDAGTVAADEASVQTAQLNLGYTVIRSPVDGKTGAILVYAGNLVIANNATAPLVTITQVQPVMVSFFLPQSDLPKLEDRYRAGKLTATIAEHDAAGTVLSAPVTFIGNQVQSVTGTIELRATFKNDDLKLVPGQLVDLAASISDIPNAIVVPREAVNLGPDTRYVFVVDDKNIARQKSVQVLYDDGTNDAIQGPVKAGDKVVTVGQVRVTNGQSVDIRKSAGGIPANALAQ
jgi:membrane fusion protein, multidrug efflux system